MMMNKKKDFVDIIKLIRKKFLSIINDIFFFM